MVLEFTHKDHFGRHFQGSSDNPVLGPVLNIVMKDFCWDLKRVVFIF